MFPLRQCEVNIHINNAAYPPTLHCLSKEVIVSAKPQDSCQIIPRDGLTTIYPALWPALP
jgi:hypothetical protein